MWNMCKAGAVMKKYDICVFDLDGTLIDSLGDLAESCNEALRISGMPTHEIDRYRTFVGSGIKNLIKRSLLDKSDDEVLVQTVYDSFNSIYQRNCLVRTKTYSGINEMLLKLKECGVKLCVLSNKADEFSQMIADSLFEKGTFDLVWGKKSEFPIKPDPSALFAMLDKMTAKPDRCLYIGDSDVDCITARNAGVDFCGVEWGFRGKEELAAAGAKLIVRYPYEITRAVCADE